MSRIRNQFFWNTNRYSFEGRTSQSLVQEVIHDWRGMEPDRKISLLQEIGDRFARSHCVDNPPHVAEIENTNLYGSFTQYINTIGIDMDSVKNPFQALDTIYHEETHNLTAIRRDTDPEMDPGERAVLMANRWEYIGDAPGEGEIDRNNLQTDEMISNLSAMKAVMQSSAEEEMNLDFEEYLQERQRYLNTLQEDRERELQQFRENSEMLPTEMQQLRDCYDHGNIPFNQRDEGMEFAENNPYFEAASQLQVQMKEALSESYFMHMEAQQEEEETVELSYGTEL